MRLAICYLYSSGMNVYGDRGNVLALVKRCRWRGIEVELDERGVGERGPLDRYDLFVAGGGQDRDQVAVSHDLRGETGQLLREAIERDAVLLAICGTYQLLGRSFRPATGDTLPGIGVFDAWTDAGARRFIGDVIVRCSVGDRDLDLVGFENHSGRTFLGPSGRPMGRTIVGAGNNGDDGLAGARYRNAFGCYLHGPLLPKNPDFADYLIRLALRRRHGEEIELAPLDDRVENAAREAMIARIQRRGRVKSGAR
ncbi:MAG: type 1 glutamine amidotransferase [Chloroflexota bacterium]